MNGTRALATMSAGQIAPASDLQAGLFNDFIRFIDRGEKTTRTYITNLRQFAAWLKYASIARPVRADVISYRDYLAAEHDAIELDPMSADGWAYRTDGNGNRYTVTCRPNTVAQYLRSVSQFFRWTAVNGLYPNIAENVHPPKIRHDSHRKEALQAGDVLKIEQSISLTAQERATAAADKKKDTAGRIQRATEQGKRLYAMYLLAVNAGLRTIEISRANIRDIETKNGTSILYIWGKGHAEPDQRKVIAPEVMEAINDYLQSRTDRKTGNSPLFVSTGNRSGGQRIAETTISKMLKQAMKEAGYNSDRITAHSLRHTAGTAVQELTGDLYATQKYMRHANPATTEIYLHNDTEKQEAGIAQELYNRYHGITGGTGTRDRIENILQGMSAEQLEQLAGIAQAIAK